MAQEPTVPENKLVFYFAASDIQDLLSNDPDYILINAKVIKGTIAKVDIALMTVSGSAYQTGQIQVGQTAMGCPVPPCKPGIELGDLREKECQTEVEKLLASYKKYNFERGFNIE